MFAANPQTLNPRENPEREKKLNPKPSELFLAHCYNLKMFAANPQTLNPKENPKMLLQLALSLLSVLEQRQEKKKRSEEEQTRAMI